MRYLTRLGGAVVIVLGFIGIKLIASSARVLAPHFGFTTPGNLGISPMLSMSIVLGILAIGVIASIIFPNRVQADDSLAR